MKGMKKLVGLAALGATLAPVGMAAAATEVAGAQTAPPSSYSFDTGKVYYEGGCWARSVATYYPVSDQTTIQTTVSSPYWFAACRARAVVHVKTANRDFVGASQEGMACAVLDPNCASTRTTPQDEIIPSTPALTSYVGELNEVLASNGLPGTVTRQGLVKSISISIENAH